MKVQIYSSSTELVRVAVAADRDDVHAGTPKFATSASEEEEPSSFITGSWNSDQKTVEEVNGKYKQAYVAQILVSGTGGNGEIKLEEGLHFLWILVDMPDDQNPVKLAGEIEVL